MKKQGYQGIMLLILFVWAGMLLGISFLEAPLKFHAPNVTLAIGVGIGRLVFGTLNKVEIAFALTLILFSFITKPSVLLQCLLGFIVAILLIQSLWLLPALDVRAQMIIAGGMPSEKSPHLFYVFGEVVKLITLITLGLKLFTETIKESQNAK